jgi:hypothetical protein
MARQCVLSEVTVKGFKKCRLSNALDGIHCDNCGTTVKRMEM